MDAVVLQLLLDDAAATHPDPAIFFGKVQLQLPLLLLGSCHDCSASLPACRSCLVPACLFLILFVSLLLLEGAVYEYITQHTDQVRCPGWSVRAVPHCTLPCLALRSHQMECCSFRANRGCPRPTVLVGGQQKQPGLLAGEHPGHVIRTLHRRRRRVQWAVRFWRWRWRARWVWCAWPVGGCGQAHECP
jgi:hypothetical protein